MGSKWNTYDTTPLDRQTLNELKMPRFTISLLLSSKDSIACTRNSNRDLVISAYFGIECIINSIAGSLGKKEIRND